MRRLPGGHRAAALTQIIQQSSIVLMTYGAPPGKLLPMGMRECPPPPPPQELGADHPRRGPVWGRVARRPRWPRVLWLGGWRPAWAGRRPRVRRWRACGRAGCGWWPRAEPGCRRQARQAADLVWADRSRPGRPPHPGRPGRGTGVGGRAPTGRALSVRGVGPGRAEDTLSTRCGAQTRALRHQGEAGTGGEPVGVWAAARARAAPVGPTGGPPAAPHARGGDRTVRPAAGLKGIVWTFTPSSIRSWTSCASASG
jgi:hypothetical protein